MLRLRIDLLPSSADSLDSTVSLETNPCPVVRLLHRDRSAGFHYRQAPLRFTNEVDASHLAVDQRRRDAKMLAVVIAVCAVTSAPDGSRRGNSGRQRAVRTFVLTGRSAAPAPSIASLSLRILCTATHVGSTCKAMSRSATPYSPVRYKLVTGCAVGKKSASPLLRQGPSGVTLTQAACICLYSPDLRRFACLVYCRQP